MKGGTGKKFRTRKEERKKDDLSASHTITNVPASGQEVLALYKKEKRKKYKTLKEEREMT